MEQIRIDLVPGGVTPNAHASQYDVGRGIRFLLFDNGNPYTLAGTETITVKLTKPDGSTDTVAVENTSSNYVEFVTTDGLLNMSGLYPCEISITDGSDLIGSQNFNLRAEADAYDGTNIVTITVGPADICTFTTSLAEPLVSLKAEIKAVQASGTPSPLNPLAITGFSEANITACGVNLWDEETELGQLNSDGTVSASSVRLISKNYIPIKANIEYTMHIPYTHRGRGAFYDANKNLISYFGDFPMTGENDIFPNNGTIYGSGTDYYFSFIPPENACYVKYNMVTAYGTTYNNDMSINYPSTDHDYHAYNGQTATIDLGGTIYGGVLDVITGKMTVTHGEIASYSGESINEPWLSSMDVYESGATPTTGAQVVYPLTTPYEITLTPTQVQAVVGVNNIFSDTGAVEVKYKDSIQHYIDERLGN